MIYKSFDLETTGLKTYEGAEIFSFCIGHDDGTVDVYRMDSRIQSQNDKAWKILRDFWLDTSIAKVIHNLKFELTFLHAAGVEIPEETELHDTMIMSQLLRNLNPSHALDYLCWELSGWSRELDKKVKQASTRVPDYSYIDKRLMTAYQKADGARCMVLYQLWYEDYIKTDPQLLSDYENEIELIKTTRRMEEHGICLARKQAEDLVNWMKSELDKVQTESHDLLGFYMNLNSGPQVSALLYNTLEMPIPSYTKTGKPSVDKEALSKLRESHPHPVLDLIQKSRSYTSGVSTVKGYITLADEEDRIHPTINTNRAVTGRESCQDPNLQNVEKDQGLKNAYPVPARRAFRAFPSHVTYLVDYSGIELRLIIDTSNQVNMIDMLKRGDHPHEAAAKIFYPEYINKKINPEYYSAAKNGHFALCYGSGIGGLAETLNVPVSQARSAYERYAQEYPKNAYLTRTISKEIQENGYIVTPFGRKLRVPLDKTYMGLNYMIQGTAGGILKRAQVRVDKYLREEWDDRIRLILPIHDELLISYPRDLLSKTDIILPEIARIMTDMEEIKVPLEVEWKMTISTWDKAKEVQID